MSDVSISEHIKTNDVERARLGVAVPRPHLLAFAALLLVFSVLLVLAFARAVDTWSWVAWSVLPLMAANAIWISGGAATAILGVTGPPRPRQSVPETWLPTRRTAILITLCGEEPEPVARYLKTLASGSAGLNLAEKTEIFVLSDTVDAAREDAAFADLIAEGTVTYRRRAMRQGKKPGNIADWLDGYGDGFDFMVVLDSDSRMSVDAIRHLIWRMEHSPKLGLYQASISLVPGRTRFGKYQRVTSRLLARSFGRGFAAWSGATGNYWGHNAIIRLAAFRSVARLPRLSGAAPFGGAILSHDFIEAAWIRRAGWTVELCPDLPGSAEDAPQTLQEFFARDRRWCQGNLQHIRLLAEPGLHPISRFHLLTGIFSYLAAPIWLVLLALLSSGLISVWGFLPVLSVAAVLLVPKVCALVDALPLAKTAKRRMIVLRAWGYELLLSTLLAPLIMLRQAGFVGAILIGRDCGWKSGLGRTQRWPFGWPEAALGLVLLALAIATGTTGAFWLALVIVPLLAAPVLMPKLDEALA